jgi:hypothetical protein
MSKRILFLSLISLAAVSAADKADKFGVNLYQPVVVNGTAFKAGDAKVEVADGKAIFKQGKLSAAVPVKVETGGDKFANTRIGYNADHQIKDIYVGGTNKHILFQETAGGQ